MHAGEQLEAALAGEAGGAQAVPLPAEGFQRSSPDSGPPSWRASLRQLVQERLDDVLLSTSALAQHPLRSALTLLGIVIGVFTVVAMMALTTGLQGSINKGMGGLGANTFQITRWPPVHFGPLDPAIWKRKNITLRQALALREAVPQAKNLGPELWTGGRDAKTTLGRAQGVAVGGGTPDIFANNNHTLHLGRFFNEAEGMSSALVVVLGANVADACFPGRSALGERVQIGRLRLEVVGVLERQGGNPFGFSVDQVAVVPIPTFIELYGGGRSLDISVMAHSSEEMARLQDQTIAAFRRIRGRQALDDNDFEVFSNDSLRSTFDDLAGNVQLFTLGVCVLSLLVGGIGVMNIMLVAVAERTKEIGLRKALGARRLRVLLQFVFEAVALASVGGCLGVGLGFGASWLASFAFGLPTEVPLWSIALGLGVSSAIGLVFGIYPAMRASRLDPAVALRSE